jgi:hypothetical protein
MTGEGAIGSSGGLGEVGGGKRRAELLGGT